MKYKLTNEQIQISTSTTNSRWEFTKVVLHNLQYHDYCNVDLGSFTYCYKSYSQTNNRAVNMTLTTHYSYQTLIFHSIVEVETHIASCSLVGSMKQLVLWTVTQLSAHPPNHT